MILESESSNMKRRLICPSLDFNTHPERPTKNRSWLHSSSHKIFSCLVVATSFGFVVAAAYGNNGRQYVRSHPFTITALTMEDSLNIDSYKNAGFNSIMLWKQSDANVKEAAASGLPIFMHNSRAKKGTVEEAKELVDEYSDRLPNIVGWLAYDEPRRSAFDKASVILAYTRSQHPDLIMLSTFSGEEPYAKYLQDFDDAIKPDIFIYDAYPFGNPESKVYRNPARSSMFELAYVRRLGLQTGKPYWAWIQSFADEHRRSPSESEIRMHVYTHLAAGFTGISYFTYDGFEGGAMISNDGKTTRLYDYVKEINKEVGHYGEILKRLISTDLRFLPGTQNRVPDGVAMWTMGAGGEMRISWIETMGDNPCKDGLIGYFRDDDNRLYFMIVNLCRGPALDAASSAQTFSIRCSPDAGPLIRLSRLTGEIETLVAKEGVYTITLPGGTGELFTW